MSAGEVTLPGQSDSTQAQKLIAEFIKTELAERLTRFASMSSALLIVGDVGLPLEQIAEHLAHIRVCTRRPPTQDVAAPCGQCSDCVAFLAGQSTRVKKVVPDGQFIKVEQAKEAMDYLAYKRERDAVLILHRADKFNVQAANSLLKTIEEPPAHSWILLTAPSSKSVLATIRSRVQVVNIPPLSESFIRRHLREEFQSRGPAWIQGRLDRLLHQEEFFADLTEMEQWLGQVARHTQPEPLDWMDTREGFLEGLEKIRLVLKDKLLSGQFQKPMSWIELSEKIDELESACLQNVDRKLLMDHLFMAIEGL